MTQEGVTLALLKLYISKKRVVVTKITFDHRSYTHAQVTEALTCPLNRDMTRREHNCDDWELFKHPGWLLWHYHENGGPKAFAARREEFVRVTEEPDEDYQI
ncbi:MAG: hypothetical protein EXS59_02995 [Candidatus Taylorbacteria bacterium]|nr:hypothetical protein [Candidatus Taylorbacteria bacterium]